jgi:hypothetical protein
MPTLEEWQQALAVPRQVTVESSPAFVAAVPKPGRFPFGSVQSRAAARALVEARKASDEDEVRLVTRSIVDGRPGLPWQKALGFPTRRARWRVHGWSRTRVLQGTWFEPPYGAICQTVPGVPGLPVLVIAVPFMSQM